jgi:hypothetical protein
MRYETPKQIPAFVYEMPHLLALSADNPELEDMPDIALQQGRWPVMYLKLD